MEIIYNSPLLKNCIFLFFGIHFCLQSCSSSTQSVTENTVDSMTLCATPSMQVTSGALQNEPNQEVLTLLNLPKTIVYLGRTEPSQSPKTKSPSMIPAEMVLVPAGNVQMGSEEGFEQESPPFWASVSSFLMDKSPVTVAQFRTFIKATGYLTEADKFGNAGIITEETGKQWILLDGANWEYPLGKTKSGFHENP